MTETSDPAPEVVFDGLPLEEDPLAEALHNLRMDGMFYCRSELTAPWGLELPAMPDCVWFHIVTQGNCTVVDADGRLTELVTGDVAVLLRGSGHRIVDDVASPTPVVFDLPHRYVSSRYAILPHGGGGAPTAIICGVVHLGHPAAGLLLDALPELIKVQAETQRSEWSWLPAVVDLMGAEARTAQPGGETVITRLSDILVIQAIRHWLETDQSGQNGWIAALRHPSIGRAVAAIHRDPSRPWTVVSLAAEAAMSRSAFSATFTELVGEPPKQYVTQWRMRLAEDMLRSGGTTMLEIATSLGYQSEAAFSRAFKRETGVAPSHVRRQLSIAELAAQRATADGAG